MQIPKHRSQLRIAAKTLTCRRVAPARTATYELSAAGRDGVPVPQHLVIIVR